MSDVNIGKKVKEYLIPVMVCENDQYSIRQGFAYGFDFGEVLCLRADNMKGVSFKTIHTVKKKVVKVSRKEFAYTSVQTMVGNVHWNQYVMPVMEAAALINMLYNCGKYSMDSGASELWDILEKDKCVFAADLMRINEDYQNE